MRVKNKIVSLFFLLLTSPLVQAQCAMCRAALETEDGGNKAEGINNGIVYLMAFPYLLLVIIGWAVYKIVSKKQKERVIEKKPL